jgi:hypothetical protein
MSFQLPEKAIIDFMDLYKTQFHIELSKEEALKEISDLLYIYAFTQGKHYLLNRIGTLQIIDVD